MFVVSDQLHCIGNLQKEIFIGFAASKKKNQVVTNLPIQPIPPTDIPAKGMAKEPKNVFAETLVPLNCSKADLKASLFTVALLTEIYAQTSLFLFPKIIRGFQVAGLESLVQTHRTCDDDLSVVS